MSLRAISPLIRGQGKHGFAARRRGARSHGCCEESPRAVVQRVRVGDLRGVGQTSGGDASRGAAVAGLWPFAAAQTCRERSRWERQQNGAHSPHAPSRRMGGLRAAFVEALMNSI